MKTKIKRPVLVKQIVERDGTKCSHPDCGRDIDLSLVDGPFMATIDHKEPQSWCRDNGWTVEQIWDLSNLTLMHRKCNAQKGDRRYLEDGTLPPKPQSRFRYRRDKRATRPELCDVCANGEHLAPDEICASCGSNAKGMPQWRKVKYSDCDHAVWWCWVCSITPDMRPAAVDMAVLSGESGEW